MKIWWRPRFWNSPAGQWRSQGLPGWASRPPERAKMRKNMRNVWGKIRKNYQNLGKMRKVELLPTRDCEAGYGPAAGSNYPGHLVKKTGVRTLTVLHNHDNREPPFHRQTRSKSWPWQKHWCLPYHLTRRRDTQSWGLWISLHRQPLLHGYTLESDPTLWSRLSIVLEQRNRTSVLYRNGDHSEQYCAWTMKL